MFQMEVVGTRLEHGLTPEFEYLLFFRQEHCHVI
jgi:hypothetical protein